MGGSEAIRPRTSRLPRRKFRGRAKPWRDSGVLESFQHAAKLEASGERQSRRAEQARAWMWNLVEEGLRQAFRGAPAVAGRVEELEQDVEGLKTTPAAAARVLLQAFKNS